MMSVHDHSAHEHGSPGYASPQVARQQPPEKFVYVAALYEGTGIDRPHFIAVVDVDPGSATYGQIVHRTEMPNVGDELHHFGWNACSSACHSQLQRDTLIVPGFRSSRVHLIDISDPRAPRIKNVIEGEEIKEKLGLSAPHTVHCMPGDIVTISMLGDADGNAPGGFAVLDARDFSVAERWERDPDSAQGFVDATLSSNIIRFRRENGSWETDKVIDVANEKLDGWPLEGGVPGLITDLVLSLDDRDLFRSNWLHGDLRHYDVSEPAKPELRSQVWLGGLLGRDGGHPKATESLNGGPQMLQNSLDGERVYVSNSLYSTWDNQFYPGLKGWLTKLDRQPDGSYALDPGFFVDFHEQAEGARPHEIHLPGGDCTTEIFQ
jgi:56kDa selenium binding protein (SBP56)